MNNRITDAEMAIIKSMFAENDEALKLMRKIFLPSIEVDAPLGMVMDMWIPVEIDDVTPEQAIINIKARKTLITHVEQCLMLLKNLAGTKDESAEQTAKRIFKNSSK
jgi:hypothetical protein